MHWVANAIDTICLNLNSSIQGRVLKIDDTKNRFFWCISQAKGTLKNVHSSSIFLLTLYYAPVIIRKALDGVEGIQYRPVSPLDISPEKLKFHPR